MRSRGLRSLAAGALVASFLVPPALVRGGPVLCPFRAVTGRPCPSCGLTRSWNAMAHLDVAEAATFHLLGPATFVAAVALVGVGDDDAQRLQDAVSARPVLAALGAAWVGAWAWRLIRGDRG